ncbi:MAG TPA: hypothetical protein VJL34_13405 [Anaerolineales bacterium]|nr:hypothetical protein [Anaerolineales bacterium]
MRLPDYWLERPDEAIDDSTRLAFDDLLETTLVSGGNPIIQYTLPAPKWQFLCHLADHHALALHGSGNAQIASFEPRQSNDLNPFGNQKAVYAAADGIWAMFFAISDRDGYEMTVTNACIRQVDRDGMTSGPFYFFSVSKQALARRPWRTGTVYLLPRATFETQPPLPFSASEVHIAQLASRVSVQPLARLTVDPSDFPFLSEIRGHDDRLLQETATALQTGGPLPEAD